MPASSFSTSVCLPNRPSSSSAVAGQWSQDRWCLSGDPFFLAHCVTPTVFSRPKSVQTKGQVRFVYHFATYLDLLREVFPTSPEKRGTLTDFLDKQKWIGWSSLFFPHACVCSMRVSIPVLWGFPLEGASLLSHTTRHYCPCLMGTILS